MIAHNTSVGLSFYNDRVQEVMDVAIMAEPFTYVPPKAGHLELVGGNALVIGKITEGYDVIETDVSIDLAYEDMESDSGVSLNIRPEQVGLTTHVMWPDTYSAIVTYHKGDIVEWTMPDGLIHVFLAKKTSIGTTLPYPQPEDENWQAIPWGVSYNGLNLHRWRRIVGVLSVYLPLIVRENDIYYVTISNLADGIASITGSYTVQVGDTCADVKAGLEADLVAKGAEVVTDAIQFRIMLYQRVRYYKESPVYEAGDVNTIFANYTYRSNYLSVGYSVKRPILKCGAVHGFGIVYKDRAGRTCSVIKKDSMSKYIPFYSEDAGNDINKLAKLTFNIAHLPPEWAETYEIVYFGNISMDYAIQIRADAIHAVTGSANRFAINIKDTFDWTQEQNNRWKVEAYAWQSGDRLRLVGTINDGTGVVTKYNTHGATYDYEIEETGTDYGAVIGGDWLIMQAAERPASFAGEENIIVEVYRPRKGLGETVAYGTGMVFEIGTDVYGHKYHKGDVDQVLDSDGRMITPAQVENTANDCWKFLRLNYVHGTGSVWPFWAESIFPSDWWSGQTLSTRLTSQGFPFLNDLSQRQTVLDERFRFGGALIAGTRTNNIAHFTYNDFRDLQKKDGDITGMREIGYTLKILQMYKETSVYINRVQTFNPDGTSQWTLTDSFIGDMRPMDDNYGCQHPDSVMVNGRYLYYWDNSEGAFVRSAPNGQEILDIKMKRYLKDVVRWIQTSGGKDLLTVNIGANNDFGEIWITWRMEDEVRGLIFSEIDGRFKSRIDLNTESFIHLGSFFAHLYHQRIWIMNVDEGQDYLSWGGTLTYAEVEVAANVEAQKNKVFQSCAMVTDHEWTSESKSVMIPIEASACEELQESNIPLWERKEGVFFGKIMKDENSKGNFATTLAKKLNGREMRGRYAFLKFRADEHDEKVRISSITVFSTLSERNI